MAREFDYYSKGTCSTCGRALTDPVSVNLGIGPICRIKKKNSEMSEKTENMFSPRSQYSYDIVGDVLMIIDEGGYKSVTNDMENVLRDIAKETGTEALQQKKIMYRDSMKIWDGVLLENGRVSFFPLTEHDADKARMKLQTI